MNHRDRGAEEAKCSAWCISEFEADETFPLTLEREERRRKKKDKWLAQD